MGAGKILGKIIRIVLITPIVWVFKKIIVGAIIQLLIYLTIGLTLFFFRNDIINWVFSWI
jgi:hypothetical protein